MYPNPSDEGFKIDCSEKLSKISVINLHGEKVEELTDIYKNKDMEIGLELPEGIYMLIVEYASQKREAASDFFFIKTNII